MKADLEQYRMVKEALFERANLLEIAPHLSAPLPIMLPIYKYTMAGAILLGWHQSVRLRLW
ncbi:hypothetical protein ANCDUO_21878 [Ancylostoma duodenale]|uniref:glycerol-3-phosphate dehydrogenase n=1 Tax=Ancylostoma duodenale TaxID=51022 RepID=A0A0C2FT26_9BILA|nr:hypothetical protein ANCDUO_21878 [Ancylostoma duodenale]